MQKLKNLLCAARVSYIIVKAWNAVAREEYVDADKYIERLSDKELQISATNFIVKAYIKFKVRDYLYAKELFDQAWAKIDDDKTLSESDKMYLKGYILQTAKSALKLVRFHNPKESGYQNVSDFDVHLIELDKVKNEFKKDFPFRDHPDWERCGVE